MYRGLVILSGEQIREIRKAEMEYENKVHKARKEYNEAVQSILYGVRNSEDTVRRQADSTNKNEENAYEHLIRTDEIVKSILRCMGYDITVLDNKDVEKGETTSDLNNDTKDLRKERVKYATIADRANMLDDLTKEKFGLINAKVEKAEENGKCMYCGRPIKSGNKYIKATGFSGKLKDGTVITLYDAYRMGFNIDSSPEALKMVGGYIVWNENEWCVLYPDTNLMYHSSCVSNRLDS